MEVDRDDQQINPGSVSNPNQQIFPLYCDAPQSSSSIGWSPNGSNLSANDVFENTELITHNYSNDLNIGLNQDFIESQFAMLSNSNKKVHNESKPITVLPKKRKTRNIPRNSSKRDMNTFWTI